jgi:hypothetical protein
MLITLAIIAGLAFCGATVPLGKKTFFGHVKSIWSSEEMGELKDGVKDTAKPAVEKGKEFVKGGVDAVKKHEGSGSDHAPAPGSPHP